MMTITSFFLFFFLGRVALFHSSVTLASVWWATFFILLQL